MDSTIDFWNQEFWSDLLSAQEKAVAGIHSLHDEVSEGYGCDCTQCVVNVVLDNTWPIIDAYVASKGLEATEPTQAPMGCGGGGNCTRCRKG